MSAYEGEHFIRARQSLVGVRRLQNDGDAIARRDSLRTEPHTLPLRWRLARQRQSRDGVGVVGSEHGRKVLELPPEVLMYEESLQRGGAAAKSSAPSTFDQRRGRMTRTTPYQP